MDDPVQDYCFSNALVINTFIDGDHDMGVTQVLFLPSLVTSVAISISGTESGVL